MLMALSTVPGEGVAHPTARGWDCEHLCEYTHPPPSRRHTRVTQAPVGDTGVPRDVSVLGSTAMWAETEGKRMQM